MKKLPKTLGTLAGALRSHGVEVLLWQHLTLGGCREVANLLPRTAEEAQAAQDKESQRGGFRRHTHAVEGRAGVRRTRRRADEVQAGRGGCGLHIVVEIGPPHIGRRVRTGMREHRRGDERVAPIHVHRLVRIVPEVLGHREPQVVRHARRGGQILVQGADQDAVAVNRLGAGRGLPVAVDDLDVPLADRPAAPRGAGRDRVDGGADVGGLKAPVDDDVGRVAWSRAVA